MALPSVRYHKSPMASPRCITVAVPITKRKWILVIGAFLCVNIHWSASVGRLINQRQRQSPYKLNPTGKTVVLPVCENQNIALRSHLHDATHLNNDENRDNVVLETYLASQHNNALYTYTKIIHNEIVTITGEQIQQKMMFEIRKVFS